MGFGSKVRIGSVVVMIASGLSIKSIILTLKLLLYDVDLQGP